MNMAMFETFDRECAKGLPKKVGRILETSKGKQACAIGFITTDDFYGFYLSWDHSTSIDGYYNWENGLEPDFLYQPLVDTVESCKDIDFCKPSAEKWAFARALLSVLEKNIRQLPHEIFQKNGFQREDVLFFAAMSDGDYIQEMMDTSVKMFNAPQTLEAYGIIWQ